MATTDWHADDNKMGDSTGFSGERGVDDWIAAGEIDCAGGGDDLEETG